MGIGLDAESAAFIAAATLPKALLSEPELMLLLVPDEFAFVLVPVTLLLPPAMVTALDTDVESEFRLDPPS